MRVHMCERETKRMCVNGKTGQGLFKAVGPDPLRPPQLRPGLGTLLWRHEVARGRLQMLTRQKGWLTLAPCEMPSLSKLPVGLWT